MLPSFITWDVNPAIIDSFVTVRWYGLMFAIGFWLGFNIVAKMFKREGMPERWLGVLLIYVGVATIVGARLGHVFFYQWDYYSAHPWKILATWEGGLASHGGAIGIIIAVILYSIFTTKKNPLWTFDRLTVAIALVGCLIRIGNLMNSEIFGVPTELPRVPPDADIRSADLSGALRPDDVDVLEAQLWRASRSAFRHIPRRHLRLTISDRVHKERPGGFRGYNDLQHGTAAEHTVCRSRHFPYNMGVYAQTSGTRLSE